MNKQMTLEDLIFNDTRIEEKNEQNERNTLLLLDGPNILNRAYYATSFIPERMMRTKEGQYVNGIHGFLQMLNQYLNDFKPTHIAICFDEGKSFRKKIYPEYKDGRKETPPELKSQFPIIREILPEIGIPTFSDEEFEADDFIASLKESFLQKYPDGEVFIISNDQDLLQLVDNNTTVVSRKSKNDVYYNPLQFSEDYHDFEPKQIIDLKAIEGDTSDNIKGIPGIGGKGAVKLLKEYKTVENLLANKESLDKSFNRYRNKIIENGKEAIFCKKLTTLIKDIEQIKGLSVSKLTLKIDLESFIKICQKYQFTKILNGIENGKWQ